jgi:hypothetical protein
VLKVRSAFCLDSLYDAMHASKASQSEKTNDIFATDIIKMSKYHIIYTMFIFSRQQMAEYKFKDQNVLKILEILLKIVALK